MPTPVRLRTPAARPILSDALCSSRVNRLVEAYHDQNVVGTAGGDNQSVHVNTGPLDPASDVDMPLAPPVNPRSDSRAARLPVPGTGVEPRPIPTDRPPEVPSTASSAPSAVPSIVELRRGLISRPITRNELTYGHRPPDK